MAEDDDDDNGLLEQLIRPISDDADPEVRLQNMTAADVRALNQQLVAHEATVTRNTVLLHGIQAGAYCLALIRKETGGRRRQRHEEDAKGDQTG